ncbi:MAG: D-alanyl-D-alanine carboxypeptidase family protein [Oscillospiraceae bacterium]|nr:D-alanyl-D-alanine carboxypeptidase family protein [Oscillospiraceae bacterium]
MPKKGKLLLIIGLIILLVLELGFAFGYFGFYRPYRDAKNTMPKDGTMMLVQDTSGSLTLSWPEGFRQDRYLVQFLQNDTVIQEVWTQSEQLVLPELPKSELLTIRVLSARGYRTPFAKEEQIRMGTESLSAEITMQAPAVSDLAATADPQAGTVNFTYTLTPQSRSNVYYLDNSGEWTLLDTLDQAQMTLSLGDGSQFSIPHTGEELTFAFDAYRVYPGLIYYGAAFEQISVVREDLLTRDLNLECTDLGDQVFLLTWAETKGDYYQVQRYRQDTASWETLQRVEVNQERSYTTDMLSGFSAYHYRVVAVGGQVMEDSEFAAVSDVKSVVTGASAKYCTIWPIKDLAVYSDTDKIQSIGTAPGATTFCVLGVKDGMFRIRLGDGYGYIDSNYCLINLPELLGDLCLYDITNSTESLYMAHEFEIPSVTGTVIVGYENVQLYTGEQLVPLLYPTALRLEEAAYAAMEQGYKLKIYDAYRPQEATIALYNQALDLAKQPIPDETYTGKVLDDLPVLTPSEPGSDIPKLTYGELMTDFGRYTMNYFLAAGKSRHNKGIALDLTLTDMVTGEDLSMQTSMHDLSWYSELKRNNDNAKTLAAIMESVGFSGLVSEWWHFNDMEAQNSLTPPYLRSGVCAECWMADDYGWRYRRADGSYVIDCTEQINGVACTFDEYGYLLP